ncbi:hypothetical protein PDJAM_G00117070 [Pangasius djambal]|uniref:Uncharacterized protein n=1 Tax=Pangasius djambal TaxID=1691987 RepID=A0ACC5Z8X0_9TELE|nr:hypothetical protein [Pangasius djambal]
MTCMNIKPLLGGLRLLSWLNMKWCKNEEKHYLLFSLSELFANRSIFCRGKVLHTAVAWLHDLLNLIIGHKYSLIFLISGSSFSMMP